MTPPQAVSSARPGDLLRLAGRACAWIALLARCRGRMAAPPALCARQVSPDAAERSMLLAVLVCFPRRFSPGIVPAVQAHSASRAPLTAPDARPASSPMRPARLAAGRLTPQTRLVSGRLSRFSLAVRFGALCACVCGDCSGSHALFDCAVLAAASAANSPPPTRRSASPAPAAASPLSTLPRRAMRALRAGRRTLMERVLALFARPVRDVWFIFPCSPSSSLPFRLHLGFASNGVHRLLCR
jgi:hypothetical protein